MIEFVRGELAAVEADKAVVDVDGIGFGVFMSGQALGMLPSVGEQVKIYTYLNVKEDAMQLYGFLTRDDLEIFRLLIGVSGIGPKGALGILTGLTPDELRFAVMSKDVKAISAAPGIGKKTAEKLILELKDKLRIEDVLDGVVSNGTTPGSASGGSGEVAGEAVQALVALGYGSTEALQAVKKIEIKEDMEVEEVLKAALKYVAF
ncbi:MAG TPA: Holliday junction branch migration protein RuvA [Candidatus Dorea gallistercoris]|uniref:Holliday junction branch migration complex subunit RuvA n=1 Tax=Candidatus Dorea gallistercoris TaxID=2838542 RepID=A0A9D1UDM4_9FIRM|nr:Holliday junction branch migration protein RuvA [Candidatus Dorea gallistercoris]